MENDKLKEDVAINARKVEILEKEKAKLEEQSNMHRE